MGRSNKKTYDIIRLSGHRLDAEKYLRSRSRRRHQSDRIARFHWRIETRRVSGLARWQTSDRPLNFSFLGGINSAHLVWWSSSSSVLAVHQKKKIRRNRRQIPKKKERKEKQKQSWKNESSLGAALGKSRRDQRLYFIIPYTVTQRDSPLRWSTRQKGPVRKKERDNGLCCERTRDLFWSNHTNESMLWLLNKKRLLCVCVSVGKEIPIIITSGVTYC